MPILLLARELNFAVSSWVTGTYFDKGDIPVRSKSLFLLIMMSAMTLQAAETPVDFERDIQPIFVSRCYECHGAKTQKSDYRLDLGTVAFRGGESEIAGIVPGKSSESHLIQLIRDESLDYAPMPPKGEPLTDDQIALLTRWIDEGADWPNPDEPHDLTKHWAYQKPTWPDFPQVQNTEWVQNPIDRFILARLENEDFEPNEPADRYALIRRVYLDLIGLPPTPEQADAFANDKDPKAFEKVVDELLASPAYGEKWARHWLDLARYADSNGFEKDSPRVIWPYRDWVIRSLNQDLPFDQFAIEQIAGDMLPGATRDQIIATGFNRNSMINEEGGVNPEEAQAKALYDRIDTVSTVFLATTMACVQCHDHKYDPFDHAEYFGLYAIFNNQESDFRIVNTHSALNGGPTVEVPSREHKLLIEKLDREKTQIEAQLRLKPTNSAVLHERLWELNALYPKRSMPTTMVMRELPEPRVTHLHEGGAFGAPGEVVQPGLPKVWPALPGGVEVNRLTFARWLVSPENPLTARVYVNRVWQQYFGTGIVKTTEDFGTQGEKPVHPELLDWLALNFQFQGWSMKSLHRLIVTSAAYQQSSNVSPEKLERDPYNRLLTRGARFRLPAEAIRDQALFASGLLSQKIGGPSVFPPQPPGIWKMPYSGRKWETSQGEDRFRRGLYTWWQRTAAYPAFMTFDAPSREATCSERPRTNTPLQALITLNDPVYMTASLALARRAMIEPEANKKLEFMFRQVLVRPPTPGERFRLLAYYDQQFANFRGDPIAADKVVAGDGSLPELDATLPKDQLAAWTMLANVLFNLDETLTKG